MHEPPYLKKLIQINDFVTCKISELSEDLLGQKIKLGGVILETKKVMTKKSAQEMAFVRLSDGISEIEMVVFPKLFVECRDFLQKDEVIIVLGRLDKREENLSLVVDSASVFDPENAEKVDKMVIITIPKGLDISILQKVNKVLRGYPGDVKATLLLPNGSSGPKKMILPFTISPAEELINELQIMLGDNSFKFS